jgi:uncharacterized protein YdcH (DUF465 family)
MTNTNSKILEDVTNLYNRMVDQHRKLDKEIIDLHSSYGSDQKIKALKMNKLHLKQEIEELRVKLKALISV